MPHGDQGEWKGHALPVTSPASLSSSQCPGPMLGTHGPILEAAHGEGSQPQRLKLSQSILWATGGHKSYGLYRVSLNPLGDLA